MRQANRIFASGDKILTKADLVTIESEDIMKSRLFARNFNSANDGSNLQPIETSSVPTPSNNTHNPQNIESSSNAESFNSYHDYLNNRQNFRN